AALVQARHANAATVRFGFGAGGDALVNPALDALLTGVTDHRTHVDGLIQPVSDAQRGGCMSDRIAEPLLSVTYSHGHRDGETTLPGASEGAVRNDFRRCFAIGVGHDHHVIFGAALALHALAARRTARVNILRHGSG